MNELVVDSFRNLDAFSYLNSQSYKSVPSEASGMDLVGTLNTLFSSEQRALTSRNNLHNTSSHSALLLNQLSKKEYTIYKQQFVPNIRKAEGGEEKKSKVSDEAKKAITMIEDLTATTVAEMDRQTMNHIIFSVTIRFGSSINQLVRGT